MRTGPSIHEFLEDSNIIKYDPYIISAERTKSYKYIIKKMSEILKKLAIIYEERKRQEKIRILNNKGKGYYINGIFYAPANPIKNDSL